MRNKLLDHLLLAICADYCADMCANTNIQILSIQDKLNNSSTSYKTLNEPAAKQVCVENSRSTSYITLDEPAAKQVCVENSPFTSCNILDEPAAKRLRTEENNAYDLFALLQSSTSGKMILAHFKKHACLNNSMQREPANEIINNELCNNINTRLQSGISDQKNNQILSI